MGTQYILLVVPVLLFFFTGCSQSSTSVSGGNVNNATEIAQDEIIQTFGNQNTEEELIEEEISSVEIEETKKTPAYLQFERDGSNLSFESVLAQNTSYTRYQISYRSEGFKISGIMNIPNGDGVFPLIILIHGYIDPAVYTLGRGLKREQDYLARQGFAVLHTDYRNHAFSDTDESLESTGSILRSKKYGADAINAVLAVQQAKSEGIEELTNVDPEKVGMLGHSMGGGVTMFALVAAPEILDAAILYAPVHSQEWYNYKRWREDSLSSEEKEILETLYGDLENPESFASISPESYFENMKAPVQMYFGTLDESCPIKWGDDIEEAFRGAGKDIEYIKYEGEKHEFVPRFYDFMEGSSNFFKKELS